MSCSLADISVGGASSAACHSIPVTPWLVPITGLCLPTALGNGIFMPKKYQLCYPWSALKDAGLTGALLIPSCGKEFKKIIKSQLPPQKALTAQTICKKTVLPFIY